MCVSDWSSDVCSSDLQGKNILVADGGHVLSERFSQYVLKGQASGDDEVNGRAASAPSAEAKDPAVTRYRPMLIIGEDQSDIASLKKRAEWEATTRAGRAQQARVTRSEEHTSELQSLMRISYAVICLKKK